MILREFRKQTGMVSPRASIDAQIGTEDNLEIQEIYLHVEDGHPFVTLVIGRDPACPSRNLIDADELLKRLEQAHVERLPGDTGYWQGLDNGLDAAIRIVNEMRSKNGRKDGD